MPEAEPTANHPGDDMKVIEIEVKGCTGSGKSHVLDLIERALKAEYGPHTQVASYDLSVERGLTSEHQPPKAKDTVFVLTETNQPIKA